MKKVVILFGAVVLIVSFAAFLMVEISGHAEVAGVSRQECPYLATPQGVTMEIAEIFYTDEVVGIDGNRLRLTGEKLDKFRVALVTVKVKKPAGKKLSVAAADLTLHYYHGDQPEVAPCEGLSTFSRSLDVDRPIKLPRMSGPDWVKQTTGTRATRAGEVYFDVVFNNVEPDTREVWLGVGQPSKSRPFISEGWKKK